MGTFVVRRPNCWNYRSDGRNMSTAKQLSSSFFLLFLEFTLLLISQNTMQTAETAFGSLCGRPAPLLEYFFFSFLPFDVTCMVCWCRDAACLSSGCPQAHTWQQTVAIRPTTRRTAGWYLVLPCPDRGSTGISGWKNTGPKAGRPEPGPGPSVGGCRTWTSFLFPLQPANIK